MDKQGSFIKQFCDSWKKENKVGKWGLGLGIVALAFFILGIMFAFLPTSRVDHDVLGGIGDFIGGTAGTLGSLAALLYVINSVKIQQEDLKHHDYMQKVNQQLTMIYDLLQTLRSGIVNMRFKKKNALLRGRDCFRAYCNALRKELHANDISCKLNLDSRSASWLIEGESKEKAKEIIVEFFSKNHNLYYCFVALQNLLHAVLQYKKLEGCAGEFGVNLDGERDEVEADLYSIYIRYAESEVPDHAKLLLVFYSLLLKDEEIQEYFKENFYTAIKKDFNSFFSYENEKNDLNFPLRIQVFDV